MEHKKVEYKRIWNMLWPAVRRPARFYVPWFAFMGLVITGLTLAEPVIYGQIIDSVVRSVEAGLGAGEGFGLIVPFLLLWGLIVIFQTFSAALFKYAQWRFGNYLLGGMTEELFARMLRLDVERFREEKAGELLRRFDNSWDAVWQVNSMVVRTIFQAGLTLAGALVVGFFIDWRMTLVTLIPVPLIVGVGLFSLLKMHPSQHKVHKFWEKISGHVGDNFVNISAVKSHVGEKRARKKYENNYLKAMTHQLRLNRGWATAEAAYGGIYVASRLFVFAVGAWLVFQGTITLGTLIMFLGFMGFIFGSVQQVITELPELQRSLVRLSRAASFWYEVPKVEDVEEAKDVKRVKGEIEFRDIAFAYHADQPVLRGLNFIIPQGQTWALVGESGAGKSTLAQMMLRFMDPDVGQILIDGLDIKDMKLSSLRKNVGFVMQENMLFHQTVHRNIAYSKPGASRQAVVTAAKRAQAHQFIKELKSDYNTMVGERGVKLSGGQKQRIALARVFLEDPPILVLDEATSALDSKTEHDLQQALREVMKDRTTIVIAHRLSTVMAADNILVMDKGKIVDQGTHEELMKKEGLYKQYWQIQAGGYV